MSNLQQVNSIRSPLAMSDAKHVGSLPATKTLPQAPVDTVVRVGKPAKAQAAVVRTEANEPSTWQRMTCPQRTRSVMAGAVGFLFGTILWIPALIAAAGFGIAGLVREKKNKEVAVADFKIARQLAIAPVSLAELLYYLRAAKELNERLFD